LHAHAARARAQTITPRISSPTEGPWDRFWGTCPDAPTARSARCERHREAAAAEVFLDIDVLVDRVGMVLAGSERDGGDTLRVEGARIEAAVRDVERGRAAKRADLLAHEPHDRRALRELEGIVGSLRREADLAVDAARVLDALRCALERSPPFAGDLLEEGFAMAPRLAGDDDSIRDLIRRFAACDPADVRGAFSSALADPSEEPAACRILDRARRDEDRRDAILGVDARVRRAPENLHLETIGADRSDADPLRVVRVVVEAELRIAEIARLDRARAEEADLLSHREEKGERWMVELVREDVLDHRDDARDRRAVVRSERRLSLRDDAIASTHGLGAAAKRHGVEMAHEEPPTRAAPTGDLDDQVADLEIA